MDVTAAHDDAFGGVEDFSVWDLFEKWTTENRHYFAFQSFVGEGFIDD